MKSELKTTFIQSTQDENNNKSNIEILWKYVYILILFHIGGVYGIYLILSGQCKLLTIGWLYVAHVISTIGITGGAHRLWSHRSYKATWQLRVLLMLLQTSSYQNDIFFWARDHRVHHKFTDTEADPHNPKRGLFFAHIGWLVSKKHEAVKEKAKTIDFSDLYNDSVVMFQRKYYFILAPLFAFVLPALLPWYFFGETLWNAYWVCSIFRFVFTLNSALLINSAAHAFGNRPYDENISAAESGFASFLTCGEGWHNYHHTFPWDYKAAELPGFISFNYTCAFIDLMAKIGWAYDLKTVSKDTISKRKARTGKTSANHQESNTTWGWDEAAITKEEIATCKILYNMQKMRIP